MCASVSVVNEMQFAHFDFRFYTQVVIDSPNKMKEICEFDEQFVCHNCFGVFSTLDGNSFMVVVDIDVDIEAMFIYLSTFTMCIALFVITVIIIAAII